jgi:hypothetical protein
MRTAVSARARHRKTMLAAESSLPSLPTRTTSPWPTSSIAVVGLCAAVWLNAGGARTTRHWLAVAGCLQSGHSCATHG